MTAAERVSAPACPFSHGMPFDPRSLLAADDPEPWFSLAREHSPVFYVPELQVWYITRYADVVTVLKDTQRFSSRRANRFKPITSSVLRDVYPDGHPGLHSMLLKDPPEHSRVRRLVAKAFTPTMVAAMHPFITQTCERLVADFASEGTCDLLSQFSSKLPTEVMTDLAGATDVPGIDLATWGEDYFALIEGAPPISSEREEALAARANTMLSWLSQHIDSKRENPGDDLISALLGATTPEGDPSLTTKEVIAVLSSMMSAGIETTSIYIPEVLSYLLRHPGLWQRMIDDPSARQRLLDEGLRIVTPARGVRRTTTCPVTIAGVHIPEGDDVFISFRSANYDETVFPDASTFEIDRDNADRHLSFGRGTHFCIGQSLAKLEIATAFDTIIEALPDLRVAAGGDYEWLPNAMMPRPTRLQLEWDATRVPERFRK